MRRILLAGTALTGMASQVTAGTPVVSDNQEVIIAGNVRFSVHAATQDNEGENASRGYKFQTDEAEVKFAAQGTADNGLEFGLQIELQTQTDDLANADEAWVFLQYENAGRMELGDQDGAADRVFVAAEDVMAGRGGFDGPIDTLFNFGNAGDIKGPSLAKTADATKISYFSPRFQGFQAAVSWTPDLAQNGGAGGEGTQDNNANNYADTVSAGVNYQRTIRDVSVIVAAAGEYGRAEAGDLEELKIWGVGTNITFAGFSFGAGYADRGKTDVAIASSDNSNGGTWWDIAAAYATGALNVSAGAFFGDQQKDGADIATQIYSVAATYALAPGLAAKSDVNYINVDDGTAAPVNNKGYSFVFSLDAAF